MDRLRRALSAMVRRNWVWTLIISLGFVAIGITVLLAEPLPAISPVAVSNPSLISGSDPDSLPLIRVTVEDGDPVPEDWVCLPKGRDRECWFADHGDDLDRLRRRVHALQAEIDAGAAQTQDLDVNIELPQQKQTRSDPLNSTGVLLTGIGGFGLAVLGWAKYRDRKTARDGEPANPKTPPDSESGAARPPATRKHRRS